MEPVFSLRNTGTVLLACSQAGLVYCCRRALKVAATADIGCSASWIVLTFGSVLICAARRVPTSQHCSHQASQESIAGKGGSDCENTPAVLPSAWFIRESSTVPARRVSQKFRKLSSLVEQALLSLEAKPPAVQTLTSEHNAARVPICCQLLRVCTLHRTAHFFCILDLYPALAY